MSERLSIPLPPFDSDKVYLISMESVFADHDFNSRGVIDLTSVLELAKSIASRGLDQPITVQPWLIPGKPDIRFRIIAGYRRHAAHRMNKAEGIRALVKEGLTEIDARVLNLTENLQRLDLNPKQEAKALEHLKNLGLNTQAAANRVGKSYGWVQERYYLLDLPEEIQDDVAAGLLTMKHVRLMRPMQSIEQQFEFAKKIKDAKLLGKVREVNPSTIKAPNEKRIRTKEEMYDMQDIIREAMGNNLATAVLAWATATISDLEMHRTIKEWAGYNDKDYIIPDGLEGSHATVVKGFMAESAV